MIKAPSKVDCYYIVEMLKSNLIDYRHTQPWADRIIERMQQPPTWLFDISMECDQEKQISVCSTVAYGEPFNDTPSDLDKFHMACLWVRYEQSDLSWADLLIELGGYLDGFNVGWPCEVPYHYLNLYEAALSSEEAESETKRAYLNEQNVMPWVRLVYQKLKMFSIS